MLSTFVCTLLLLGCVSAINYQGTGHPGRDKRHTYRLSPKYTGGFSDEWCGMCHGALHPDYDQLGGILDPDPRVNFTEDKLYLTYQAEQASAEEPSSPSSSPSKGWYEGKKSLPFKRRRGDDKGLQVLIVTIDNRPLRSKDRNKDTESIDNTAIINERYASRHGYDYLYIKTSEPGIDGVCPVLTERYNCTFLEFQCQSEKKGKYDIATYHVGHSYGRASSWNRLPPLIYLTSEYGHLYDYFLFIDSDVMLNSRFHDVSLSDKLDQWQDGQSPIAHDKKNVVWGQPKVRDSHMLTLTNYPWRDDLPCAGVFMLKPDRAGLEMLIEWWDYNIPLKNIYDFMEQDALWYMISNDGKFKVNSTTVSMIYEPQFNSRTIGVPGLFFVHMANYVEQKDQYVNVMFKDLKIKDEVKLKNAMTHIMNVSYVHMDTVGLCEYAEVTRTKLNIPLRRASYFPHLYVGKDDDEWHNERNSKILPFGDREKYYPPMGRLYNGYAMGFKGFRSLFYVLNDTIHEFPDWDTFVGMGFDLDHTLQFRDFGRRKPCAERTGITPGWPLNNMEKQRQGLGLFDYTATTNGTLTGIPLH